MTARSTASTLVTSASPALRALENAPLTLLHLAIIALCACGFAIDLSEIALGSILSVVFSAAPHLLGGAALSWLLSSVFLGSIAGAPLMGWVADRIGLKPVLALIMIWLAVTSVLAGVSTSPGLLIASRLLSGLALGAYPPLMISYLTDLSPIRQRGGVIFATCAFAYLGPPLVIFGVRWLTPLHPLGLEAWRWPFLAGGVFCALAGLLFLGAPEAPHWLEAAGRSGALARLLERFRRSPTLRRSQDGVPDTAMAELSPSGGAAHRPADAVPAGSSRLPAISLLYFLIPWATVSFPLLTGPILLARHYSLSDALLYIGLATFGPVIGTLLGGLVVDRIDRRIFMGACALAMIASVGVFFWGGGLLATACAMILFGLFSALYLPAMTMFGAEMFDAGGRGRATTIAWVANRIGATLAPVALVPLVHAGRYGLVAGVMFGVLAVGVCLLVRLPASRRDC